MTDRDLQQKRLIAAVIDIVIALAIAFVFFMAGRVVHWISSGYVAGVLGAGLGLLGSLVGLGYILARDIVAAGNSIGKKSQGLRVTTANGGAIALMDSVKRNAIFAISPAFGVLMTLLGFLGSLGGPLACLLVPLAVAGCVASVLLVFVQMAATVVEIIKISQDPEGIRLGDAFAGTRVVR